MTTLSGVPLLMVVVVLVVIVMVVVLVVVIIAFFAAILFSSEYTRYANFNKARVMPAWRRAMIMSTSHDSDPSLMIFFH